MFAKFPNSDELVCPVLVLNKDGDEPNAEELDVPKRDGTALPGNAVDEVDGKAEVD